MSLPYELNLGDTLEEMDLMEDNSVDMILCDLPYGTTACKWDTIIPFEPLWAAYRRVAKKNAAIVLTASQPFTSALVMSNVKAFRFEDIWRKSRATGHLDAKRRPMRCHENILVFAEAAGFTYNPQMTTGKPNHVGSKSRVRGSGTYGASGEFAEVKTDQKYPVSVVDFDSTSPTGRVHNTQKPVALMEYLIRTYTNPGELVLDNTMGSGTTGVACMVTGRRFYGIERDESYFAICKERIAAAYQQSLTPPANA